MEPQLKDRHFVLLEFNTSPHGTMALRGSKTQFAKGIDILFWGVEYLDLLTFFTELEFGSVEQEDIEFVRARLDRPVDTQKIFVFRSGPRRYRVVAERMEISETLLDGAISPFRRTLPRPIPLGARGIATIHWLTPEEGGFQEPPIGNTYTERVRYLGQHHRPKQPAEFLVLDFLERPRVNRTHKVRVSFLCAIGPDDFFVAGNTFEILSEGRVVARGKINRRIPPRRPRVR